MDAQGICKEFETEYCKDCDPYNRCDDCTIDTPYSKHLESLVLSQAERIEEQNIVNLENANTVQKHFQRTLEYAKTITDLKAEIEELKAENNRLTNLLKNAKIDYRK